MNVHELSEDELDQLADFTAGVLDPADHEHVAHLIATDERWAVAHTALVRAEQSVRSDLRSMAGPIAMPADVKARLDAAMGSPDRLHTERSWAAHSASASDAADRSVVALPTQRSGRPRHGQERSPWRRAGLVVVGVAAAAALVGGVGLVTDYLRSSARYGSSMSAPAAEPQARGAAPSLPGGPVTLTTGRDYQPNTLDQLARAYGAAPPGAAAPEPTSGARSNGTSSNDSALQAPGNAGKAAPDLSRLTNPDALRGCLAAIQPAHPGTPTVVDFAAFEGSPAVIVVIGQPARSVIVVVGPACGLAGADERYATTVG
jgi:hypothetical protein